MWSSIRDLKKAITHSRRPKLITGRYPTWVASRRSSSTWLRWDLVNMPTPLVTAKTLISLSCISFNGDGSNSRPQITWRALSIKQQSPCLLLARSQIGVWHGQLQNFTRCGQTTFWCNRSNAWLVQVLSSYLHERTQIFQVEFNNSVTFVVNCSVSQGLVLGMWSNSIMLTMICTLTTCSSWISYRSHVSPMQS